jgi:hypothetical protein
MIVPRSFGYALNIGFEHLGFEHLGTGRYASLAVIDRPIRL